MEIVRAFLEFQGWTRILVELGDKYQAIRQFTRLMEIVETNLDHVTIQFYLRSFEQLIHIPFGRDIYEQEENYRAFLLDKALTATGGVVTKTAKKIGISHQNTSKMLRKFPELCEKHNVKIKIRSTDSLKKDANPKVPLSPIIVLKLNSDRLRHLGLRKGMTIQFKRMPLRELNWEKPVVILDINRKYHCGILVDAFDMFAFEDGLGNIETTYLEEEIYDAGQVIKVLNEKNKKFIPLDKFL